MDRLAPVSIYLAFFSEVSFFTQNLCSLVSGGRFASLWSQQVFQAGFPYWIYYMVQLIQEGSSFKMNSEPITSVRNTTAGQTILQLNSVRLHLRDVRREAQSKSFLPGPDETRTKELIRLSLIWAYQILKAPDFAGWRAKRLAI